MKKIVVDNSGQFAAMVTAHIRQAAQKSDRDLHVGVPGGRGAVPVISGILQCELPILRRIHLYLVDERISGAKNMDTLLDVGLQKAIEEDLFRQSQIHIPEEGFPFMPHTGQLDLLYLGVGEDGHIASLFPGSYPELDARDCPDTVRVTASTKPPPERITISFRGLRTYAKRSQTFLMFFGEGKRIALERFLEGQESPATLPCMYFPREWFTVDVVTDMQEVLA